MACESVSKLSYFFNLILSKGLSFLAIYDKRERSSILRLLFEQILNKIIVWSFLNIKLKFYPGV